jgi:membrane associated rhomboid family serine protease
MLLTANVIVFAVYWLSRLDIFLTPSFALDMESRFPMVPLEILRGQNLITLLTSMFTHFDPLHLLSNMVYLYIFGDNVEDAFGHLSYLAFYLVSGLAAAFAHIFTASDLTTAVIGASGAISGVLGGYIVLYPKARVWTFVFPIVIPVPAIFFLGIWFVMQWILGIFDVSGDVAYWAHIGGFIAGMVLAGVFGLKRKKQRQAKYRV